MIEFETAPIVRAKWTSLPAVRIGTPPTGSVEVTMCVVVRKGGEALMRIDYHGDQNEYSFVDEWIEWRGLVVLGAGENVHLISLVDHSLVTHRLGEDFGNYFAALHPLADRLYVTSGAQVFRIDPARNLVWASDPVGLDGVILSDCEGPILRGDGEWGPPGGWKPFAISADTGFHWFS
ncbi:MAG: hypothetical protein SGI72_09105 [Planctomycetota bacterium]|nr:hypothetical protein [Planctomycetota bacterium]